MSGYDMSGSERLKAWMRENGFEVKTLALHLNFNTHSIYKFLDGDRAASFEFRYKFADAFGMEKSLEIFGEISVEQTPA